MLYIKARCMASQIYEITMYSKNQISKLAGFVIIWVRSFHMLTYDNFRQLNLINPNYIIIYRNINMTYKSYI